MASRDTLSAEAHRWLVVVALGLSALVFGPRGGLEGGSAAKTSVVLGAGLVALLIGAGVALRDRAVTVVWHPAVALAVAFGVAMFARALLSDAPGIALVGPVGRANGAGLYVACVVLFLAAAARSDERTWAFLANGLVIVGAIVALSAIDEATVRLGPDWAARPGNAGTLGNANFLAGWAGSILPIALVVALDTRRSHRWRVAAIAVTLLLVVAAALSGSLQAGFVTVATAVFLGLVWSYERLPRPRWRLLAGTVVGVGALGGVLTALGAYGSGPLAPLRDQVGIRLRAEYWAAAARMVSEAPLTGIGPGRFVDRYREFRSPEAATLVDLTSSTDSAHSVPLHLWAEGGVLVAALYVAFLVLVAVALAQALRRTSGRERLWVGAFGAAWLGYVLQSLISIDVAPLAVLGWVLGGIVVGATAPARRFGAPARARQGTPPAPVLIGQAVGAVVLLVVAIAGAWAATLPYRADAASARGTIENRRTPDGPTATSTAIELAPWRDAYYVQLVRALEEAGRSDAAQGVVRDALEVNDESFEAVVNGARLAWTAGDVEVARERYELALELDPWHPDILVEAAQFAARNGDTEWASELVDRALRVDPDHEAALQLRDQL